MSIWVIYGIVATVGVLVIAGIVVGSILLWRRQVRKSLVGLVGRREAVSAAYRGTRAPKPLSTALDWNWVGGLSHVSS